MGKVVSNIQRGSRLSSGGQKFDGKRVELFGQVYEWAWDEDHLRWTMEKVWNNAVMEMIAELQRAVVAGDTDEMMACLDRLNEEGHYEFGEAPRGGTAP